MDRHKAWIQVVELNLKTSFITEEVPLNYHQEITNSPGMWLSCSAIVVVVFIQAIKYTIMSYRLGGAIGIPRKKMIAAFRTGFITAIIPSFAILLGLAILIPSLGTAFPWMRLSVIGSVVYELIASGIAAKEFGVKNIVNDPSGMAFTTAVWVMSMGFLVPLLFVALFTQKISSLKDRIAGGDNTWMDILSKAAFFGAAGFMVAQPIVGGGPPRIAIIGGFVSVVILGAISTVGKQKWLKEWMVALSIIGGMTAVGLGYQYFSIGG